MEIIFTIYKKFMKWLELDDRQPILTETDCAKNSRPYVVNINAKKITSS